MNTKSQIISHDMLLEVSNWWKQEHGYKAIKHLRKKKLHYQ